MPPSTASPPKPPSHRSAEASSPPVPPSRVPVQDVAGPQLADLEDQAARQQRRGRRPEVLVVGRQGGEVGRREAVLDGQARAEAQHAVGVIDLVVGNAVAGGDVEAAVARGCSGRGPDARLELVRRGVGDHRPGAGHGRSHDASLVVRAVAVHPAAERHVHPRAEQPVSAPRCCWARGSLPLTSMGRCADGPSGGQVEVPQGGAVGRLGGEGPPATAARWPRSATGVPVMPEGADVAARQPGRDRRGRGAGSTAPRRPTRSGRRRCRCRWRR